MDDLENIIEDFSFLETWEEKYQHLIDMGKNVDELNSDLKIPENKLPGCQSTVYFVVSDNADGTLGFLANSDAFIVQGLIALLLKIYSNKTPQQILDTNTDFLRKIGLDNHLSPTRKNGLSSMISKIKKEAELRINAA